MTSDLAVLGQLQTHTMELKYQYGAVAVNDVAIINVYIPTNYGNQALILTLTKNNYISNYI